MPSEPPVPFLEAIPPAWGPAERFPVLYHLLGTSEPRPLLTPPCESEAYRSRMFSCWSSPKPVSRCFPR
jgi:hypothetical protein